MNKKEYGLKVVVNKETGKINMEVNFKEVADYEAALSTMLYYGIKDITKVLKPEFVEKLKVAPEEFVLDNIIQKYKFIKSHEEQKEQKEQKEVKKDDISKDKEIQK